MTAADPVDGDDDGAAPGAGAATAAGAEAAAGAEKAAGAETAAGAGPETAVGADAGAGGADPATAAGAETGDDTSLAPANAGPGCGAGGIGASVTGASATPSAVRWPSGSCTMVGAGVHSAATCAVGAVASTGGWPATGVSTAAAASRVAGSPTGNGSMIGSDGRSAVTGSGARVVAAATRRCRRISIQTSSPPRATTTVKRSPFDSGVDGSSCSTAPNSASARCASAGSNCATIPAMACRLSPWFESSIGPADATTYGFSPTCMTSASPSARTIAVRSDATSAIRECRRPPAHLCTEGSALIKISSRCAPSIGAAHFAARCIVMNPPSIRTIRTRLNPCRRKTSATP